METLYADSWSDMAQPCDMDLWVMKWISEGQHYLYFTVQWFCHILKTIWCMYIILWEYESVCPMFDLKINVVTVTYIPWSSEFALSWRLFDVWTLLFGIMSQYDPTFDLKINVGHCDLYFMVQWFCLMSWRLFDVCKSDFGSVNQYDQTFDLKINVGHCDLYFIVQWFCITSWKLFDVWTSYFGIKGQYDLTFDLKINVDQTLTSK